MTYQTVAGGCRTASWHQQGHQPAVVRRQRHAVVVVAAAAAWDGGPVASSPGHKEGSVPSDRTVPADYVDSGLGQQDSRQARRTWGWQAAGRQDNRWGWGSWSLSSVRPLRRASSSYCSVRTSGGADRDAGPHKTRLFSNRSDTRQGAPNRASRAGIQGMGLGSGV